MLKKDRSHTWIIGVGYLLITIIVLVNYLTHKSELRFQKLANATDTKASNSETLVAQLEEERRIKREMSDMINNLKTALKKGQSSPDFLNSSLVLGLGPVMVDETQETELPKLLFDPSSRNSSATPFIPGKNPFIPFYKNADRWEIESGITNPMRGRLFSDPQIPLLLQSRWMKTTVSQSSNQR